MKRFLPPHDEPAVLSELIPDRKLAKIVPGSPHRSTLRRWMERGVLVTCDDGTHARLLLPHRKAGQTLLSSVAWYLAWIKEQTRLRELALARGSEGLPAKQARTRESKPVSTNPQAQPEILTRYGLSSKER